MPLYNPYLQQSAAASSQPQPQPQPPSEAPRSSRKRQAKNLTLDEMLKHPNPKIRQAAKRAINAASPASSPSLVQTLAQSSPEMAKLVKSAPSGTMINPFITPSPSPTPFWETEQFREIVNETQKYVNEQLSAKKQLHLEKSRREEYLDSISARIAQQSPAVETARTRALDFMQRLNIATTPNPMTAQQIAEEKARMSLAPVNLMQPGAATVLMSQANKPLPTINMTELELQRAKTPAVPKMDRNGKLVLDDYGNVEWEPYQFDQPKVPFFKSLDWAQYNKYLREQKLPWWKEKWEQGKFMFFSGLKWVGEEANNVFSVQKEYILQKDNPQLFGRMVNVAANAFLFIKAGINDVFYAYLNDKHWEKQAAQLQAEMNQLEKNGQQRSYQYIRTKELYEQAQRHIEFAKDSFQSFERSKMVMKNAWDSYMEFEQESGTGLFTTIGEQIESDVDEQYFKNQKLIQEQAAAQVRVERPKTYQLKAQADALVSSDPEQAGELYNQAIASMKEVQRLDALADPLDPTWSYTWSQEPEREAVFRESMAALELQKGAPLTNGEVRRLKQYYENTWTELWGEGIFDITNFIPAGVMDNVFKPLKFKFWDDSAKLIQTGLKKTAQGLEAAGYVKTAGAITKTIQASEASRAAIIKGLDKFPVLGYMKRQTVATIAAKRQNTVYGLFNRISGAYNSTDAFLNDIESIGRAATEVRMMPTEEAAKATFTQAQTEILGLQTITFEEFKHFYDLIDVKNAGIDFTNWRGLFEQSMIESEPEIRRMTEDVLRKSGKFKDEVALIAETNRQVKDALNSPEAAGWTLGIFSEKFAGAYTDAHRLYKGSALFDDSLSGKVALFFRKIADDSETDSLVRKIFKEATDKWAAGERLSFSEHLDHVMAGMAAGRNATVKAKALWAANAIETAVKAGKLIVDVWAMFVLSLNPRWIVQNYIDSSMRALINGSNPVNGAATMVLSLHRELVDELGFLPIELGQSLARDGLNFSTSVTGRLVYGNWKPLPGPLGFLSYYKYEVDRLKALRNLNIEEASIEAAKALSQRFPEGSMLRKISNLMGGVKFHAAALSGAAQDFNTAIEFTLRLRLFHKEYFDNLSRLSRVLNANPGLDTLAPEIQKLAKQIWSSSESNPRKLASMVESILRGKDGVSPSSWSTILPPNIERKMSQLTASERNLLIGDIRNQLDVLVTDIYKSGRKPVPDDFVKFFDDYAEDFKNIANTQISNHSKIKGISGRPGVQQSHAPQVDELEIGGAVVPPERISAAIERIGKTVRGKYNPEKSFDDFRVAMSDYIPVEVVPGKERHLLTAPDGSLRITVGSDLVTGKTRGELNDLMHEVTIKSFVHKEKEFALAAGFRDEQEFENLFRLFLDEEGPAKVLAQNPAAFVTIVEEFETNPNLHRILERTKGRAIAYEQTYKNYLNNLPYDQLTGQAWFEMIEARADQMHAPPAHVRHAAIRQAQKTKDIQLLINQGDLARELQQELQNFLNMYDQARKDLGQFYLWTYPGPKQMSGQARSIAWDEFYFMQADAYGYGETLKASVIAKVKADPDQALAYLREFNTNFYENFLHNHGITDFDIIEYAPKGVPPLQGEGAFAVHPEVPKGRPPITEFKIVRNGKTWNIQSDIVRKDLYERFLSPEKQASILTTQRFDLSDIKERIPLERQLFTAVHDAFKLTNEQATMYSRIIIDHAEMMSAETGREVEYYLRRMGFIRSEGHLQAGHALRQVNAVLSEQGRHLLYGFGSRNSTDLIRQTSVMFYDDLLEIAKDSERAMDDLLRIGDYLELSTGKKMNKGKLEGVHLEAWADTFQKYVLFGEAPTTKLAKPFRRFSEWMNKVTGNALKTTVPSDLPEDVLEIMDRMFTETRMAVPEAANRTARIMAHKAGVEFRNKHDLLDMINDFVAPIKKNDLKRLRADLLATGRPEEEIDAVVTMLEYRARAWAAAEPGRNPADYIRNWVFVTTKQQKDAAALQKIGYITDNVLSQEAYDAVKSTAPGQALAEWIGGGATGTQKQKLIAALDANPQIALEWQQKARQTLDEIYPDQDYVDLTIKVRGLPEWRAYDSLSDAFGGAPGISGFPIRVRVPKDNILTTWHENPVMYRGMSSEAEMLLNEKGYAGAQILDDVGPAYEGPFVEKWGKSVLGPQDNVGTPPALYKTGEQQFYLKSRELLASKLPNGVHKVDDVKRFLLGNGISKDEMYWSGIDEYLQYAVDGKITKQDLLRQIDENPVNVTPIQYKYPHGADKPERRLVLKYPRESIPSWDKWEPMQSAFRDYLIGYRFPITRNTDAGLINDAIEVRKFILDGEDQWVVALESSPYAYQIPDTLKGTEYGPKDVIRYAQEHGVELIEENKIPGVASDYQANRLFDDYDEYSDTVMTIAGPMDPRMQVVASDSSLREVTFPALMSQHFEDEGYLYHLRSQTVTRDGTRTKVLLELQSDVAEKLTKTPVGGLPKKYKEQGLRQIVREAVDEGATRMAWIADPQQLYKIEGWTTEALMASTSTEKAANLMKFYLEELPKTIQKTFKQFNVQIKQVTIDGQVLNYIDITPEMRVSLMKSESLFKNEGAQTLGTFTRSASGKNVVGVFAGGRVDVLPHEFGHAFRTELPEADLRIIEQATGLEPGEFTKLRPLFDEYRKLELGVMSPYAASLPKAEYDVYFKTLQKEAARYEKAEEMFAEGFVRYLHEGKSPIPELTTVFEKFKAWLTELWRAIKRDPALRLTKEVRGVYDRLFELPYGQVPTPTRYISLGEVPHDVAARVFPSIAGQQIVDNLNAAFDVWKLRHELKGIPPEALKDFSTAKAFVNQQFDESLGDLANEYRILKWRFEQFENTMMDNMAKKGFLGRVDQTVDDFFAPTITDFHVDDGVKTYMRNGVYNRSIYEQMMAGIQEWRNFLTDAAEKGTPYPVLTAEEAKELQGWATGAAERKAKMMDLSIHGGSYGGVTVSGALPETNRIMLDYQDRNNFDQLMKNFFPFWMFPSRSLPFWVNTMATNPRIVLLYQKMRKMSESERYQAGAVTSQGKPLPSLENYIPIPGLDLWINPAAPLSFRYLLDMQSYADDMMYRIRTKDEGDETAYGFIAQQFMETSPVFGFTPGPWVNMAVNKLGVPTQKWSLIPQTNLIPPWMFPEIIQRSEYMMNWLSPEVPWHDFLVERYMLEGVTEYVNDPKVSDIAKKKRLGEISQAIAEKGDNELWQKTYKEFVTDEKNKNVIAYFTGFYPKEFSDSQADLLQARNEYIMRASSMNNSFQANIFQVPLDEQIRYDDFRAQYKVDTPLGWLYHLYGDIGWVTDDSDRLVNDPSERAKIIAQRIEEDNKAREFFKKSADLEKWKNQELASMPIGANYEQTQVVLDKYFKQLIDLETDLMPAYKYMGTNKPVKLIEKDLRNLWWKRLSAARPGWVDGMDYLEYEQRVGEWEKNLPNIALAYSKYFALDPQVRDYIKYLDVDQRSLDLDKVRVQLVRDTNVKNYAAWKLENDDIFTALNAVWKENYWDKYWDAVAPLKNEERDLEEMRFFENNPQPSTDQLYRWIVEKYGPDRFSMNDIQRWMTYDDNQQMEVYDIDERHLQDVGEVAVTREKIWNMLSWAGPGKQRDVIQNAFLDVGGNPNDLAAWFNLSTVGGPWQDDPQKVMDFYNKLEQAAININLRAPNRNQLEQFMAARQENDLLNSILTEELGNGYQDVVNLYFAKQDKLSRSDFKKWKSANRDTKVLVDSYFNLRTQFGRKHKLWSSYYQWKPKPNPTNIGIPGPVGDMSMPASSQTPNQILDREKRAQALIPSMWAPTAPSISFGPNWPPGMKQTVSTYLINEIEAAYRGNGTISASGRIYLNALYKTHREWRPFIETILSIR